jgi:hypothetical protein
LERTVIDVYSRLDDRLNRARSWAVPAGVVILVLLVLLVWAAARNRILLVEPRREGAANSKP